MPIKTVFVDMDGTTVDWLTAITLALGKTVDIYKPYLDNPKQLDYIKRSELLGRDQMNLIMATDVPFWEDLKPFTWTYELISTLQSQFEVAFLSKPSSHNAACVGKNVWCKKYYPGVPLILCNDKELVSSPNKYLIDDDERQYSRFTDIARGGHGWLFEHQFTLAQYTSAQITDYIQKIVTDIRTK